MFYDEKELYYVFSSQRISGTSSNFLYQILLPPDNKFDYVGVLHASVPKTYYLVDQFNNNFYLQEGATTVELTMPSGNYTLSAFTAVLRTTLNAASPNGWTYSVIAPNANSTNTGYFIFNVTGNTSQPSFIFTEALYIQMGFNQGTYTFVANTLSSVNVINLQYVDGLYIHSDMCSNKNNSILQEVHPNTIDYSNIVYQATEAFMYSKPLVTNNNNVYRFSLTDENSNEINLNGSDWHFTLVLFKINRTMQLLNHYIKYKLELTDGDNQ
jgi:hypothetical protein